VDAIENIQQQQKMHSISYQPHTCDDKSRSGDTAGRGIVSNILNTRLSTILLENIQTSAVEEAVPSMKVVLDAASLHQQRKVLRLELSLQLGL
jgi:hypothetical protein